MYLVLARASLAAKTHRGGEKRVGYQNSNANACKRGPIGVGRVIMDQQGFCAPGETEWALNV